MTVLLAALVCGVYFQQVVLHFLIGGLNVTFPCVYGWEAWRSSSYLLAGM